MKTLHIDASTVGVETVCDETVANPALTQGDLTEPIMEVVLRVEVALPLGPLGTLPIVPATARRWIARSTEAVHGDIVAHTQPEGDGKEPRRRDLLFCRLPPPLLDERPQFRVEARIDGGGALGVHSSIGLVLARPDPLVVADDDIELWHVESCHEEGLFGVVHSPRSACTHISLVLPRWRCVHAEDRIGGIDGTA